MSERSLPPAATLRFLKLEAKRFLKAAHAADSPRGKAGPLKLAEAQHLLANEYGFASWAQLKLRVAELEFARGDREEKRAALIDAVCAWGWDHDDYPATADLAEAIASAAPPAMLRGDFVLACITGEVEAVRDALVAEPALATTLVEPRGWQPLLYVSYSTLLRGTGPRAGRLVEVARLLLAHGADPNCHYQGADSKFPALYASIDVTANLALAAVLLEHGANPSDGQSLYHAAERFDTEALELLFSHKLDPADISYCLLHKLDFQHVPGIRWFLDHGADPNARHPMSGESALHWAIKRASSLEVIELLLERGADPDARTLAGHTLFPQIRGSMPLDLARRLARTDIAAVLRARGATETPPSEDDALVFACLEGTARATAEQIAQLAPQDHELLAHLAQQDRTAAALRLLEQGWPAGVRGWMNATPLHWAACRGNATLARALLAHDAPVVDVGGYFKTPLHTALYCHWNLGDRDYIGVLEALVAAGVALPDALPATDSDALDAAVARLR